MQAEGEAFKEDAVDVGLYGVDADAEGLADLLVGMALIGEHQDPGLGGAERRRCHVVFNGSLTEKESRGESLTQKGDFSHSIDRLFSTLPWRLKKK